MHNFDSHFQLHPPEIESPVIPQKVRRIGATLIRSPVGQNNGGDIPVGRTGQPLRHVGFFTASPRANMGHVPVFAQWRKNARKVSSEKKGAGDFHNAFRKRLVRDFINTGVIPPQRGERKLAGGSESGLEFRPSGCTESMQAECLNSKQASAHPG